MRSPEDGHTPTCWIHTLVQVMELELDTLTEERKRGLFAGSVDNEFRIWLQDNGPLHTAERELNNGVRRCICDD